MVIKYCKQAIISLLFLETSLCANATDCLSAPQQEEQGCSILSILKKNTPPPFQIREELLSKSKTLPKERELNITKELTSVEVTHENQKIVIKRNAKNAQHTCPPFCIEPMNIKGITTVGELEVLSFIKELKEKEPKLLIDIRSSKEYKEYTIPGAINIPLAMLDGKSKYQKDVLKLLGRKKIGREWRFKHVPSLLIFGNNEESSHASQAIKILLKLSYPNRKILFYRAGIESWNRLGLTIF